MEKAQLSEVSVREFRLEDLPALVDYWLNTPEEVWIARGVDKSKIPSRERHYDGYQKAFAEKGGVPNQVTVLYRGQPIGTHLLNNLIQNESGLFHAHFWDESSRGKGIAVFSYLMACDVFFKNLELKKIIFKTPKINIPPNRVKEKIGIPCIGDTVLDAPILFKPLEAKLYELDWEMLRRLKKRHGI